MELIEYMRRGKQRLELAKVTTTIVPQDSTVTISRNRRQEDKQESRARQRERRFDNNRNIHIERESAPSPPADPLRKRLAEWQAERQKLKKLMPKPLPPFRAGRAPPPQPPKSTKSKKSEPKQPPTGRPMTRAAKKAASASKTLSLSSLAPPGTLFHAPTIVRKLTPRRHNFRARTPRSLKIFKKALLQNIGRNSPKKLGCGGVVVSTSPHFSVMDVNKAAEIVCEREPQMKTPESKGAAASNCLRTPVVNSPFVTVKRGKHSSTEHIDMIVSATTPEKSAQYFRLQLEEEIKRLLVMCEEWKTYQENNQQLIEDHQDMINVAIGQTQLLINKKFQQFRQLIERCESQNVLEGEGVVKVQDLQGFWDMVYMQVENLDIRFNQLKTLKDQDWKEDVPAPQAIKNVKKPLKRANNVVKKSSGLREKIQAARLNAKKALPTSQNDDVNNDNVTFNGGYFTITSPAKKIDENSKSTPVQSIRKTLLRERQKKASLTPLNMTAVLAVSSAGKYRCSNEPIVPIDLNKTPAKSILKTPGTNKKMAKNKVLFTSDDNAESQATSVETELLINLDNLVVNENQPKARRISKRKFDDNTELSCKNDLDTKETSDVVVQEKKKKNTKTKRKLDILDDSFENDNIMSKEKETKLLQEISTNVNESLEVVVQEKKKKNTKTKKKLNILDDSFGNENRMSKEKETKPLQEISTNIKSNLTPKEPSADLKHNRQSFNLISFESPAHHTHATRSTLRKLSLNPRMEEINENI